MKVLGIVGSPRKGGNTDILVSQVLKGAVGKGALQEKIYLDDFQIKPCKACGECAATGKCIADDDFHKVLKKIKACDAIVLGSPIYCKTVTAQTKVFIDRVDSSQVIKSYAADGKIKFSRRSRGNKKGAIVCVGDLSPLTVLKQAAEVMSVCLSDLGIKVIDEILARKLSEPGEVSRRKTLLEHTFSIGTLLVDIESHNHQSPFRKAVSTEIITL